MRWFRWLFKCCMDCGIKLPSEYDRGDVCQKCFDEFNGMTLEELLGTEGNNDDLESTPQR